MSTSAEIPVVANVLATIEMLAARNVPVALETPAMVDMLELLGEHRKLLHPWDMQCPRWWG